MKMPEKNPDIWAFLYNMVAMYSYHIWLIVVSLFFGVLRAYYYGKSKLKGGVAAAIVSTMALSLHSILELWSLPKSLSLPIAIFGIAIGVEIIDRLAIKFVERKSGLDEDKHE